MSFIREKHLKLVVPIKLEISRAHPKKSLMLLTKIGGGSGSENCRVAEGSAEILLRRTN